MYRCPNERLESSAIDVGVVVYLFHTRLTAIVLFDGGSLNVLPDIEEVYEHHVVPDKECKDAQANDLYNIR